MTEPVSLWDDTQRQQTNSTATATTADTNSEESPLAAAIEASHWSREDIDLALSIGQFALMAWFVAMYRAEGSR